MADIFEDKTKMVPAQSKEFVTAAEAEPQFECCADVPGLYQYDHGVRSAPSPKIGAKV